jgi:hypothetical protein
MYYITIKSYKGNEYEGEWNGKYYDSVLRLKQITGLAEAFADKEFSRSWEVDKP